MVDYFYNPKFWSWTWDIYYLAVQSWLLPLLAALITRHFRRRDHLRIIAFAGYALLIEHLSSDADLSFLFHGETNSPWYHLLLPVLFLLMTRFFADYLDVGKYRWLRWALPSVFTILVMLNALWGEGFYRFPATVVALYSFTGIVLSIGYFIHLLRTPTAFFLERQPMFWISSGLLVYFAGNFLLWLGLNFLTFDAVFFKSVYRISGAVTILLNFIFVIAILLDPSDEPYPINVRNGHDLPG